MKTGSILTHASCIHLSGLAPCDHEGGHMGILVSVAVFLALFSLPIVLWFVGLLMPVIFLLALIIIALSWVGWWTLMIASSFYDGFIRTRQSRRVRVILQAYLSSLAGASEAFAWVSSRGQSFRLVAQFSQAGSSWSHCSRGSSIQESITRLDCRLIARSGRVGKFPSTGEQNIGQRMTSNAQMGLRLRQIGHASYSGLPHF